MRKTFLWLIALSMLALVPVSVNAIGISPPIVQLEYIPGHLYEIPVKLTNYNDFPVGIQVRVEGELGHAYFVKQPITVDAKGSTIAKILFTAPEKLSRPGYHTNYVFFKESFIDKGSGTFSVRTEVGVKIILWQPYPGSYAEVTASAPSVGQGNNTVLKLSVYNLGVEPIDNGRAVVKVISGDGEIKDIFTFSSINMEGNTNKEFFEEIPSSKYKPGRYTLATVLNYGSNSSEMNGSFIVGTQDIDVLAVEGPIYLDKPINKFKIHVQSLWNLPIENIYGTLTLGSNTGDTSPIALKAFGKETLDGFWETDKTVVPGNPLAYVTVHFADGKKKEAVFPITVYNETPPEVPMVEPTVEQPAALQLSVSDLIIAVLATIIVISIILFAYSRFHNKDDDPPPPEQPGVPPAQTP